MDDKEFQTQADAAIDDLYQRLVRAVETHDFEVDFNAGALAVEFETPPAKFIVSPNSPVKQIWVSAHSKSFKFDWDPARAAFVLGSDTLAEMMANAVSRQLGEPVKL
ncbi:MAG: iron donor protein CyaY [Bryobacteraceae bacterium]